MNILLIDDEDSILDISSLFLKKYFGDVITTVNSPTEAVNLIQNFKFDVIVSDYEMPEINGIQLLKIIRTNNNYTPFIIFTGKGREDVVIEALNNGASFYLQKGGDPAILYYELSNMINQATSRQKAERDLSSSQQKLQGIVLGSPVPQFVIDINHCIISWNKALEQYTNIKSDDVIGTTFAWKAFYSTERPTLADLIIDGKEDRINEWYHEKILISKKIENAYEITDFFPSLKENGVWFRITASLIYDSQGEIIGAVETLEDITDYKTKEQDLLESKHKIQAIINQSFQFLCILNSEGKIEDITYSTLDFFKIKKLELNSKLFWELECWINSLELKDILRLSIKSASIGEIAQFKSQYYTSDNLLFVIDFVVRPIKNENGEIFNIIIEGRDITDQINTEISLQESRNNYQKLIENVQDAIYQTDIHGNLIMASPSFAKLLFYDSLDECLGLSLAEYFYADPDKRDLFLSEIQKEGFVNDYEVSLTRKDGTEIIVSTNSHYYYDDNEAILGVEGVFRDITDKKEAENKLITAYDNLAEIEEELRSNYIALQEQQEKLEESEKKYKTLFETTGTAIAIIEEDNTISLVNSECVSLCGYPKEDIEGKKKWTDFVDREDQKWMLVHHKDRCDGLHNVPNNYDFHFIRKNGESRNVYLTINLIPGTKKSIVSLHDITSLKQAQVAILENKEKYRLLLENANDAIFFFNVNQNEERYFTVVNDQACQLLGYSKNDFSRMNLSDIDTSMNQKNILNLQDRLNINNRLVFETEYLSKYGEKISVEISARQFLLQDREVVLICARDIRDRKKIELALKEKNSILNAILHSSPLPQYVVDRYHHIISWNQAIEDWSGINAEEVIGTDQQWRLLFQDQHPCLADLIIDEKCEYISKYFQGSYKKSKIINEAYEIIEYLPLKSPGGNWIVIIGVPIYNSNGEIIGAIETLQDITEYKISEEILKQLNQKLNILQNITRHDILNQVTALTGYCRIIEDITNDPEILEINTKKKRITKSIQEHLKFSREYQQLGIKSPKWHNIQQSLERVFSHFIINQIQISYNLDHLELFADCLIDKVFYNLIDNSLRHGGKVNSIEITCEKNSKDLFLIFEDNGTGINYDAKDKIFKREFYKNSGFGLFLSREILSITDLEIIENGVPGMGARFVIQAPEGKYKL